MESALDQSCVAMFHCDCSLIRLQQKIKWRSDSEKIETFIAVLKHNKKLFEESILLLNEKFNTKLNYKNILALDNQFPHEVSSSKSKREKQLNQTTTKKFHCSFCHKSYHQKSHQLRHERIDHQPPKFKCASCTRLFKQKVHLQRHQMHTKCYSKEKTD